MKAAVIVTEADPWQRPAARRLFIASDPVEALAPDGEVMVVTTELRTLDESGHIARYLSRPTGELTQVSSGLGRSTRMAYTWYVIIGASVFEVR